MYTTLQVATTFRTTRETARHWSLEFREYLSPTANPGRGRDRLFTEDDLRVLSLVSEYKRAGRTFQDIHVALKAGQRGSIPDLAPVVSTNERTKLLDLEEEVQSLRTALSEAFKDNQRQAGQIELLQQQLRAAEEKADKLRDENAVLRFRLDKE